MLEIHIAVFLFGIAGLFGKFITLPALVIVFGRTFFASIVLGAVSYGTQQKIYWPEKSDRLAFLSIGILLAFHWFTFFYSIQISTVAIALLTFSSFPVFVTALEPILFKEKFKLFDAFTAMLVLFGLILVVPGFDLSNNLTQGLLWGLLSGFTFAILSLFNRKFVANYPPLMIGLAQNGIASLVLFPLLFIDHWILETKDLILLIILGVFCTAAAQVLFIKSLKTIKTQLASVIASLEPLYGIILAFLLLDEIPSARALVGGGLILGAIFVATSVKRFV